MSETAGERLARMHEEAKKLLDAAHIAAQPITRGDVLFVLELLWERSSRAIEGTRPFGVAVDREHFVIANMAAVLRDQLKEHWGING